MDKYKNIIIGIDEVGRGPLAGPLAVGVFLIKIGENTNVNTQTKKQFQKLFHGVKESKQLSPEQREKWFTIIKSARDLGLVDFSVQFESAKNIDSFGLTRTINSAMKKGLDAVLKKFNEKEKVHKNCMVLLDGGLHAPTHFKNQKTIIRGDEKKTAIALASICAKVLRDRRMKNLAQKYPHYGFEIHKGYGTRAHISALRKYGPCPLHRRSFIKKI